MIGAIAAHYVAAAGGGASANYDAAILALGPAAYFTFSQASTGGWTDASGNGMSITYNNGGVTANASGGPTLSGGLTSGFALFNLGRLGTSIVPSPTSTYSVVGWVRTTTTAFQYLFGTRGSGIPGLGCYVGGAPVNGGGPGTVSFGVTANSVWSGKKTSETINDGTWRHVAVTFDNSAGGAIPTSAFKIYIGGALATLSDSNLASMSSPLTMNAWNIGQNPDDGGGAFVGDMSRLAFFPTALTAQNVADIFAAA